MDTPSQQMPPKEPPSALEHLVQRFQDIPDFRCDNANKEHLLVDIVVLAICAVLGGANSWLAVERFAVAHQAWFRSFVVLANGIPSHDTFRRVFLLLNPLELSRRFAQWMAEISERLQLKQVAIDGKTLCGSGVAHLGIKALHMVHAFATANGICLAQQATAAKSNEITAIPELLKLLDVKGALVTIDAMGCQKEIAADIVAGEGDYVLAVKGNQERLYDDVQQTLTQVMQGPEASAVVTQTQTHESNRGRWETRTCLVTTNLSGIRDKLLWKGLKIIGMIITEREVNGKKEKETRYFISSRLLSAQQLLLAVRDHWKVENQLHWVLDVVFGEDGHQLRTGHGAHNFTTLRKLAHALIKNTNPKHGIKGTREMAGWDTNNLERLIHQATVFPGNLSA
jgi:predicted transposase YbfD/YdcC